MGQLAWDYDCSADYDEMFERPGIPRDHCRAVADALKLITDGDLNEIRQRADLSFLNLGITFTVYNETSGIERIFPFDLIPRVIAPHEWTHVENGLKQRVLALNAFVQDVYNEQRIITEGLIPPDVVFNSPNFDPSVMGFTPPAGAWIVIAGIDLVRDRNGSFYVLEDNARTPSGVSYVLQNRLISTRTMPRIFEKSRVLPVANYANQLQQAIYTIQGDGTAVLLTPGVFNSAYFEHTFLAKQMGVQLVEGRDLVVRGGQVVMKTTRGPQPVTSMYRRVDDEFLDPANNNPVSELGDSGLFDVYRAGGLCNVNAVGTGIADDKSIYPYVPEMIRFYLGEEAILPNVPTFHGADEKHREHMLAHLDELVVKPTNASGGYGVVIGPRSTAEELNEVRLQIEANPAGYIAQPLVRLSTAPTVIDGQIAPRRVDLRPFIIFDGREPWVLPGGLTRVALKEGSFIVNSSQGGGSKDTWVLDGPA